MTQIMTLQSQVDALKDGDYVRAVFDYKGHIEIREGNIQIEGDAIRIKGYAIDGLEIRDEDGFMPEYLVSITPITPPIRILYSPTGEVVWKK